VTDNYRPLTDEDIDAIRAEQERSKGIRWVAAGRIEAGKAEWIALHDTKTFRPEDFEKDEGPVQWL
jgi:hypothetical protein